MNDTLQRQPNQFTYFHMHLLIIFSQHPQTDVSPECDRPSLTPIHNTNQPPINYIQKLYRNSTKSYQVVSMTPLNKSRISETPPSVTQT